MAKRGRKPKNDKLMPVSSQALPEKPKAEIPPKAGIFDIKEKMQFACEVHEQRAENINRAGYDEMQLAGFLLRNRIRNVERIIIDRGMKPDKKRNLLTTFTIFYTKG